MTVKFEDIKTAQKKLKGHLPSTRTRKSPKISDICSADIYFKFENRQHTGAFKDRGALNCLLNLTVEQSAQGVVAMSAGNHAQGVAYHAGRLGIPATIVMPENTPYVKVRNTENYGATVVLQGDFEGASAHALVLEKEQDLAFVHPYDDVFVIAGQGTIALEMLDSVPDLDCLVVPIGGGGLISGMVVAAKAINPNIKVYGVQTEMYPAMKQIINGETVKVGGATIAEGIAVKQPGKITQKIVREMVDDILIVKEQMIERALVMILDNEKSLVEGAGAASLAAVLSNKDMFKGKKCGLVLCGGNIDQRLLANILMRDMVNIGRLGRLRINLPDQPGVLSKVSGIIGECGGNVVEMTYQHIFSHASVKETSIEIAVETKGSNEFEYIIKSLNEQGFKTVHMQ